MPTHGGLTRLVKLLGLARAKEVLLGGDDLDADAARAAGLLSELAPSAAELPAVARARVEKMLGRAPLSFAAAKRLLHLAADVDQRSGCWPRASPRPRCCRPTTTARARGRPRAAGTGLQGNMTTTQESTVEACHADRRGVAQAASDEEIEVVNPATEEVVGERPERRRGRRRPRRRDGQARVPRVGGDRHREARRTSSRGRGADRGAREGARRGADLRAGQADRARRAARSPTSPTACATTPRRRPRSAAPTRSCRRRSAPPTAR